MEGRKHSGVILEMFSEPDVAARTNEGEPRCVSFRVSAGYDFGGVTTVRIHETIQEDRAAVPLENSDLEGRRVERYTKIAEYGPVCEGKARGVVLVYTDCEDPGQEDSFNEWYSGHLHQTIEAIDFSAATRYVSTDPDHTPSKYLAIYETQNEDPSQVQKDGVDWWVKGDFEGHPAMVLRNEVPAVRIGE